MRLYPASPRRRVILALAGGMIGICLGFVVCILAGLVLAIVDGETLWPHLALFVTAICAISGAVAATTET